MAATRILKIKLNEPIEQALLTTSRAALAEAIGISRPKLNAIMKEEWNYITRDAIERVADYFELRADQVFEFSPVQFWQPLEEAKRCTFLRGSHDEDRAASGDLRIPYSDSLATRVLEKFLREQVPIVVDTPYADHLRRDRDIIDRATRETCIVIGSPRSNAATEIVLSRLFGAEPFEPSVDNRRKIPFGFCWNEDNRIAKQSSLTCTDLARAQLMGVTGIALKGGYQVRADHRSASDFRAWQTKKGVDCGLVLVANRPFETANNVKLIVIAGVHGIGTVAAAMALVQDFRYLEPLKNEKYVFGVIQAHYSKFANSTDVTFRNFAWKYRQGGSSPILRPMTQGETE